ncbi:rust resistance kinase Lr10-like [Hordeum vulgare subsp. vulgare]|uniref:Protein kinase domain-containing protein n=1 Tax=Hordeum vulgare subsp. vulgare TaxID=112509 RepID=A0A8I6WNI8_HORVV|nr:rust resistance kinase Lr10-like [Hordeum vulgare subsp. vulgare]
MAIPTALEALIVLFVLAVLAADQAEGRHHQLNCPSFSCGPLENVSSPFRQASDPPGCGYQSYELVCSDTKATISIDNATYYVSAINYIIQTFWVIDADLDLYNSCPLPRWKRNWRPVEVIRIIRGQRVHSKVVELAPRTSYQANFVNCSQEVKDNSMYMPVACLSTSHSFVYVLTSLRSDSMKNLEPSCGFLAMTPLDGQDIRSTVPLENVSYADVVKFMKYGFNVGFPSKHRGHGNFKECVMDLMPASPQDWILSILMVDVIFLGCAAEALPLPIGMCLYIIQVASPFFKLFAALCRFVLAPLVVLIFLAYKYWKTRITIDAVEKFLLMRQMISPSRYAYTDIVAVTSHFRNKLGQGGYGSVYEGVLPGDVHVAVKMLEGNSNCNGEDFINEVSTIGRIHHVNVVRLVGFCSEEMRRALVYEYMPGGSLDKYIFSPESKKTFSWDKLNEIALGIARGINYLHQGCEMQIIHFDIKPHNILLDRNFVPKVADFGLAKLYPRDESFVPSRALRGTIGYIAPEMISRSFGLISSKSDVYSFGMLLLEMAGGRRNADPNAANSSQSYYPSWVYGRLAEQEVRGISPADDMHELEKKLCIVGLWCIQMRSQDRPTMGEVIEMLEGGVDGLQMPSRPFFCDEGHIHIEDSYHLSSELTAISEEDV